MDIVTEILDNIINYSLFFYDDETVKKEQLEKYIMYIKKNINNNFCNLYFEKNFSIFHIDDVITIEDYLYKIISSLSITNSIMISAIIYLERLQIDINIFNIHKLLLISILISSKFVEDENYKNKYWSRIGGISILTLNKLEALYLVKIKYNLFIYTSEFYDKFNKIFSYKNY